MNLSRELEIAKELVLEAGRKIMDFYEADEFEVQKKEDESPLTQADLAANKIIMTGLKEEFPDYGYLTEEEADNKERLGKKLVWIIDPMDGTKEFISRNGEFTVNIGLVKNNSPVLGVVYIPAKDELYYGTEEGSFLEKDNEVKRIKVSDVTDIEKMRLVKSRSHPTEKLQKFIELCGFAEDKKHGSSVKGCIVAEGEADVYARFGPQNEWDFCAMNAIVEGAGGKMTDLQGKKIEYNSENPLNKGFLVSNGKKHKELLELVAKV